MKLIESSVERITETDPFKKIEIAGRTCYKSENKITEDSAIKFTKGLIRSGHTAMVEHATFTYVVVDEDIYDALIACKYLNCTCEFVNNTPLRIVSGNVRAINETDCNIYLLARLLVDGYSDLIYARKLDEVESYINTAIQGIVPIDDILDLEDHNIEEILAHKYYTMKFICDRAVSCEIVRHRPFSYAQESQRYVDYSKSSEIEFIKPYWYDESSGECRLEFNLALEQSEKLYKRLRAKGLAPQQARGVLPNATKTEIVVTGNLAEWKHFFLLRACTNVGRPHPDTMKLAKAALDIIEKDLINHNIEIDLLN